MLHQLILAAIDPMDPSSADTIASLANIPVSPGPLNTPLTIMTSASHKVEALLPEITSHSAFVSWHEIEAMTKLSALTIADLFHYHQHQLQLQLQSTTLHIPTLHWIPLEAVIQGQYLGQGIDPRIQMLVAQATGGDMEAISSSEVEVESFPRRLSVSEIKLYGAPPTPIPSPSTAALMNKIQDDGVIVVDLSSASPSRGQPPSEQQHPKRREYAHGVGTRIRLPRSASTLSQEFYEQVFD
jgi:hypothetical protein